MPVMNTIHASRQTWLIEARRLFAPSINRHPKYLHCSTDSFCWQKGVSLIKDPQPVLYPFLRGLKILVWLTLPLKTWLHTGWDTAALQLSIQPITTFKLWQSFLAWRTRVALPFDLFAIVLFWHPLRSKSTCSFNMKLAWARTWRNTQLGREANPWPCKLVNQPIIALSNLLLWNLFAANGRTGLFSFFGYFGAHSWTPIEIQRFTHCEFYKRSYLLNDS